jgi:hypothetical protein
LSLRSVGGFTEDFRDEGDNVPLRSPIPVLDIDDLDQDAVGEWTGSEDLYMGSIEPSEDEVSPFTLPRSLSNKVCGVPRALVNGQILQMRKGLAEDALSVVYVAVRKRSRCPGEYQNFPTRRRTPCPALCHEPTTSYQTRVRRRKISDPVYATPNVLQRRKDLCHHSLTLGWPPGSCRPTTPRTPTLVLHQINSICSENKL